MAKAKKQKESGKLECKSVQKLAWNHEEIVLENEDLKVTLHVKNPELHNNFLKDEFYDDLFTKNETEHLENALKALQQKHDATKRELQSAKDELAKLKPTFATPTSEVDTK